MDFQEALRSFKPSKEFFIGIDSDGCVFDTMEVKQKEFFIPAAIEFFNLHDIREILRETWEFVNLYSVYRGGNRFISLIKVFSMLETRKDIYYKGIRLPDLSELRNWIQKETKLSNKTLRSYYEQNRDPGLERILIWSEEINRQIAERLRKVHLFPNAGKCIERFGKSADVMVISQTPLEALEREWEEHGLRRFADMIAAQEHGTKAEHLAMAAKDKYPDDKILLIGDAFGDMNAAEENSVLFYPIIPGREDQSWERLLNDGYNRFLEGRYKGSYQEILVEEFRKSLPSSPPWD